MSTITREFTKEQLQQIIETDHVQCGETSSLARIALASLEAEAVAWIIEGGKGDTPCHISSRKEYAEAYPDRKVTPLYTAPPAPVSVPDDYFTSLVAAARVRADKAMRKFPQPNYVLNKVAEESGEVIKAVIHFTEGREEWRNVEGEIIDNLAMLIRLVMEGDQVIGFTPPDACRAAMLQGADGNSPVIPDGWVACSERMPEQFKAILAFNEYGEVWSGAYDRYWNFYCDNLLVEHVTHWMPLPAAPQQEA